MDKEQVTISKVDKPNSICFRWGQTGSDVKVYFSDEKDLVSQLELLNSQMEKVKSNINQIKEKMKESE